MRPSRVMAQVKVDGARSAAYAAVAALMHEGRITPAEYMAIAERVTALSNASYDLGVANTRDIWGIDRRAA